MTQQEAAGPDMTPDFEAAVSAAVEAKFAEMMKSLAPEQRPSLPAGDGDTQTLFRQMALAIAEISDQGTNRKRVAPDVLAARAAAHERMVAAILEAKRAHEEHGEERPKYSLTGKTYLNERFLEPWVLDPATKKSRQREIRWSGVPNEAMRPLNAAAREIYTHFLASIGSVAKEEAVKPVWMTAGGLVIEGEGPQRRQVSAPGLGGFSEDLDDLNASDPTKPFINVLGTVAAPARQNFADSAEKRV
jgi:hypothetical protein